MTYIKKRYINAPARYLISSTGKASKERKGKRKGSEPFTWSTSPILSNFALKPLFNHILKTIISKRRASFVGPPYITDRLIIQVAIE